MQTNNTDKQVKSKKRVADHGEVFTNEREVNAMLDLVKQETERIDARFLEPACGNGNFLVEILRRKLEVVEARYQRNQHDYERYVLVAIGSIYGIDILLDNVKECRKRLEAIVVAEYQRLFPNTFKNKFIEIITFLLSKNIIHGDALSLKQPNSNEPIVFSEWSLVVKGLFKRRDFQFIDLHPPPETNDLFSRAIYNDAGEKAFIPKPVREFPLTHFLKLKAHV